MHTQSPLLLPIAATLVYSVQLTCCLTHSCGGCECVVMLLACAACRALDADTRNFHAWHYRQFVVQLLGLPAEDELMYSEEKVGAAGGCAAVVVDWGRAVHAAPKPSCFPG